MVGKTLCKKASWISFEVCFTRQKQKAKKNFSKNKCFFFCFDLTVRRVAKSQSEKSARKEFVYIINFRARGQDQQLATL